MLNNLEKYVVESILESLDNNKVYSIPPAGQLESIEWIKEYFEDLGEVRIPDYAVSPFDDPKKFREQIIGVVVKDIYTNYHICTKNEAKKILRILLNIDYEWYNFDDVMELAQDMGLSITEDVITDWLRRNSGEIKISISENSVVALLKSILDHEKP